MKYKNKIICGDCLEVMREMPDNSIDTIITDPPYGIAFMGKVWDSSVPATQVWKECLRVAKPGATLLCFGGTRTYHRLACAIEDAGWILKDCIMWIYGSGFPKATDISKQLDKGHKRKVMGRIKYPDGSESRETAQSFQAGGKGKIIGSDNITEPVTPEAKLWNGWKSHGLKPAYEPILLCVKPNEGSYTENALKYGVSGLNIDGGRIGTGDKFGRPVGRGDKEGKIYGKYNAPKGTRYGDKLTGRFPANIILDEEAGKMLDEQSGEKCGSNGCKSGGFDWTKQGINMGKNIPRDKGGASRFFYVAKASKSERNMGCEGLEEKRGGSMDANTTDKMQLGGASLKGEHKEIQPTKNNHPTVKPLALMQYLCILTKTPTGGIVLDPFAGSGTTGMACKKTGRDYILIEKEPEYCKIAEARIKATPKPLL